MIEDNTGRQDNTAPKKQRLTAIHFGGMEDNPGSSDFSRRRPTSITPSPRLEAGNGIPRPPRRGPGEQRRPPRRRGTIDASMAQSRQLRRRSRRLGPQVEPPIRDLPREALLALTRKWAVATGDYRRHAPSRSGRDAVDLPVAVGNRSPEAVCRFARGVDDLCPHWAQNRRKNDAKRVDWVQKPAQKCAKRTLARTNTVGCWPWNPTRRKLSSINPSGPHRKAPRLASSHSAIVFREASERTVSSLSPASWECLSGGKERKRRSLIVTGWQPQYNRVRPHAGLAGMLRERQDSYTLEHTFTRLGL